MDSSDQSPLSVTPRDAQAREQLILGSKEGWVAGSAGGAVLVDFEGSPGGPVTAACTGSMHPRLGFESSIS